MDEPAPTEPTGGAPAPVPAPEPQGADPDSFPNPILDNPGKPPVAGAEGGEPPAPAPEPQAKDDKVPQLTPEEYVKGITVDEGAGYAFDQKTVQEFGPALQEIGLTPEQAKAVANRFAKYGAERMQADIQARQERCAAFDKQTMELIKDRPHLAEEARAGIDHYFKGRPDLVAIFMGTELSHDPAVLTAFADLGKMRMSDSGPGTANGVGQSQAGFAERLSRGVLH